MGNYVSCTLATPLIKSGKAARVVFPGGEVRQFRQPTKAAEVMLECPGFFVANSRSLHIGRRFSALGADEELEFGNVYVVFPMKRVNAMISAADMATFFMAANSAAKRITGKVQPESAPAKGEEVAAAAAATTPRLSLEGVDGFPAPEFQHRLSVCRSRKPLLETITEEPVWSR